MANENNHTCKNYMTDGGDTTVIGGKLIIEEGAEVVGLSEPEPYELPAAAPEALGGVLQGAAVADAEGDTVTATEFNALLASLRAGGIIATAAAE